MTIDARHGRWGAAMTILSLGGLAVATYLLAVRLLGGAPACGPVQGCDTVAASEYATVLGLPVALYGVGFSAGLVVAAVGWWRRADHRALNAAYGLGLVGMAAVAYLTYLELFVIEAICLWCVTYAISIVIGWLLTVVAVRSEPDRGAGPRTGAISSTGRRRRP
jgi:uncharacterized membrane protein